MGGRHPFWSAINRPRAQFFIYTTEYLEFSSRLGAKILIALGSSAIVWALCLPPHQFCLGSIGSQNNQASMPRILIRTDYSLHSNIDARNFRVRGAQLSQFTTSAPIGRRQQRLEPSWAPAGVFWSARTASPFLAPEILMSSIY